jgi:hypothetical protein
MSHLAGIPNQAPTLDEWRAQVEATGRNYTDEATGSNTGHKRAQDAELSAIVSETLGYVPPARPDWGPEAPLRRRRTPRGTTTAKKPHSKPGRAK